MYIVYVYKISRSPWAIEQKIYAVCPESFRGSQKVPEGFIGYQKVPEGFRGYQKNGISVWDPIFQRSQKSKTLWDSQRVFDFKF